MVLRTHTPPGHPAPSITAAPAPPGSPSQRSQHGQGFASPLAPRAAPARCLLWYLQVVRTVKQQRQQGMTDKSWATFRPRSTGFVWQKETANRSQRSNPVQAERTW